MTTLNTLMFTYLKQKMKHLKNLKFSKKKLKNTLGKRIQRIRSDRGGEYRLNDYINFCETHGIVREEYAPNSPSQNGVAERKNRTLLEMVSAMLIHSKLPMNFWGEALFTACYITNRILHKNQNKTPYEM